MLFNSYIFIFLFFPITLIIYYAANHYKLYRAATIWLCLASLFFYGFFNWKYLPIIIGSIVINYLMSKILSGSGKGKCNNKSLKIIILVLGLGINIGTLFYYKYFDFFITNINDIFGKDFNLLNLVLPLGISFFTFQQLSYLIDSYKGKCGNYKFWDYALFVSFFPQLIAGPIVLHSEMIPQFENIQNRKFNINNFSQGLMAFAYGLAKKVLLADTFSKAVTYGFANVSKLGTANALIVMLSYTFQIYFDFSGYCDMATGIGKCFNIDIPMNFNSPYKAQNIRDFWSRWHITLTRFFTNYIYIPLGGSKKGRIRTYINVMVIFFISGIWHGANWTFIVWGLLHGVASVLYRIFKKYIDKWHPAFAWLCTFMFINVSWIFFRAESISQAILFIKHILKFNFTPILSNIKNAFVLPEFGFILSKLGQEKYSYLLMIAFLAFGLIASVNMKNTNEKLKNPGNMAVRAIVCALLTVWSVISLSNVSEFLYWNF